MVNKTKAVRQALHGESDFGILVGLAFEAFVRELRAALAAQGFDDLHASFGYVARNLADEPLTLTALAGRLGITSPGALKITQAMEADGTLERLPDPADARARRLRLTKRGRAALAAARAFHAKFERALAARHGAAAARTVRTVLEELVLRHEHADAPLALRPV